jgi:hypothetical protein
VTVRVPGAWVGRVSSAEVKQWIADYFRNPQPLPADPGAGEGFLRLSLGKRAMRALAAATDEEPSSALRRLIRSRLGLPAGRAVMPLPSTPAEPYKQSSLPAVRVASSAAHELIPAFCDVCKDWTPHIYSGSGRLTCTVCIPGLGREPEFQPLTPGWDIGRSGRGEWNGLDVLIVAALIFLVARPLWRLLRGLLRWLLRPAPAAAVKAVVVPVEGGFLAWVPKR